MEKLYPPFALQKNDLSPLDDLKENYEKEIRRVLEFANADTSIPIIFDPEIKSAISTFVKNKDLKIEDIFKDDKWIRHLYAIFLQYKNHNDDMIIYDALVQLTTGKITDPLKIEKFYYVVNNNTGSFQFMKISDQKKENLKILLDKLPFQTPDENRKWGLYGQVRHRHVPKKEEIYGWME